MIFSLLFMCAECLYSLVTNAHHFITEVPLVYIYKYKFCFPNPSKKEVETFGAGYEYMQAPFVLYNRTV